MPDNALNSAVLTPLLQYGSQLLSGLGQTLVLLAITSALGLLGGLLLYGFRQLPVKPLQWVSSGYCYTLRNTPLILLIALIHYGVIPALGIEGDFFASACIAIGLSSSAYFSELYRGGFSAVSTDERQSAKALGLSFLQQLLWVLIPLAVLRTLPSLANQLVSLVKDTSLAALIGVVELTRSAEIVYETTYQEGPMLILLALIYMGLCLGIHHLCHKVKRPC